MRTSAFILILSLLASACSRHVESAVSYDEGLQKKLAGVWVCNQKTQLGQEIIDTIELAPGGTFTAIHTLPNRKVGLSTIEESGVWGVDHRVLVATATTVSLTNAPGPNKWQLKILRLDDGELEVESAPQIDGFNVSTDRLVLRRQTR